MVPIMLSEHNVKRWQRKLIDGIDLERENTLARKRKKNWTLVDDSF